MSINYAKRFFYGRTKGKALSKRALSLLEESLPRLLWTENFVFPSHHRICLEIGFGGGEHMLERLQSDPSLFCLGVEPFQNGIVKLLSFLEENPALKKRLKLYTNPAQTLLPHLPSHTFDEICVLFPDPWTKKKHQKRRLLQPGVLEQFSHLLKKGGELRLASDDHAYVAHMLSILSAQEKLIYKSGAFQKKQDTWPSWPQTWPLTRYGKKALGQGKPLAHTVWVRSV